MLLSHTADCRLQVLWCRNTRSRERQSSVPVILTARTLFDLISLSALDLFPKINSKLVFFSCEGFSFSSSDYLAFWSDIPFWWCLNIYRDVIKDILFSRINFLVYSSLPSLSPSPFRLSVREEEACCSYKIVISSSQLLGVPHYHNTPWQSLVSCLLSHLCF